MGNMAERYKSGVMPYAQMGYWDADYVPKDTDVLALFRITPQEGVDAIEAAAAVAGESSTATWTVVWTDRLTACELYRAKAYRVDPGAQHRAGHEDRAAVLRLHRLRPRPVRAGLDRQPHRLDHRQRLRLQGGQGAAARGHAHSRSPTSRPSRARRPASSSSASASTSSAGRCSARRPSPSSACPARNYGRVVYEALKGGLDFVKDDENINSQPFMHWRDRFLYCMEAVNRASAATGEVKGHYLNVTAGTMEDMYERAEFAKSLGCVHRHDRPRDRLHRDPVDGEVGAEERRDPAPAPRRATRPTRGRRTTA